MIWLERQLLSESGVAGLPAVTCMAAPTRMAEGGSDLYGRLAVNCLGGWQRFVWEGGSDLYGRLAVICMGG